MKKFFVEMISSNLWLVAAEDGSDAKQFSEKSQAVRFCADMNSGYIAPLLAEIEQLKAKVAELEKDREWLPIDENTPKDQEIMLSNETYVFIGEWCIDGWIDSASQFELDHVTHWKPLPKTHLELKGGAA